MFRRKLASIQVVESVGPIKNADRIEQARVMGWSVVIKKGEFAPGERCVFFEIDALLPEATWSEFMRPSGFRVKTAKLRGALSQGLALPLNILPEGTWAVGDDVTEALGVSKYEPPLPADAAITGPFPAFVPKTDEIRLQSALGVLDELRGHPYYASVKVDGTSGTFAKLDGAFFACSRNYVLQRSTSQIWTAADRYRLPETLPDGFAVQGEVCGPGVQKNRLELDAIDLHIFSVFAIRDGRFLDWDDVLAFSREHGFSTVAEVERGESFAHDLDTLLVLAKGRYSGTKNRREGIVVRPLNAMNSEVLGGGRLSFKVLNNEFLLKDED